MPEFITITIADDHPMLRKGVIALFESDPKLKVIDEAANGKELLEKIQERKPDIILLDLEMPVMDGREALIVIKDKFPEVKIIVFTSHFSHELLHYYKEKGVNAYIPKEAALDLLLDAVHSVMEHDCYFDNFADENFLIRSGSDTCKLLLTKREIEVLKLICAGMNNEEIGERLNIAVSTADYHRKNIHAKTKMNKMSLLVLWAVRNKIISGHSQIFID